MGDPPVWICMAFEQKAAFAEALIRNYAAVKPSWVPGSATGSRTSLLTPKSPRISSQTTAKGKTVVTLVKKVLSLLVLTATHHTPQVNQNLRISAADRSLKIG